MRRVGEAVRRRERLLAVLGCECGSETVVGKVFVLCEAIAVSCGMKV